MIEITLDGGVGLLRINRPDSRNALTPELQYDLIKCFQALNDDPEVGAIVISGAGEAFCAGGDVKAMAHEQSERLDVQMKDLNAREQIVLAIRTSPKLVVAAIKGPAMGAGLAIALACDIRLCGTGATFGAVHANVGLTGDFGLSWLLPSEVGASRARHMLVNASILDAQTALEYGLAHECLENDEVLDRAVALARKYDSGPRVAYAMIKQNLLDASHSSLQQALEFEARRLVLAKQTADHREALSAFVEKRKPQFSGQ